MLIQGYDEDPLVAGEELLSLPGFWATHLLWLCETDDEDDEPSPEWFGVDAADADAAYETAMDQDRWPVFRIPFADGHTAAVVYRNFPDDFGTEYVVTHPDWGRLGHLATLDGHQAGPGLAWRELVHIAHTPDTTAPGVHDPHARLLLLLPALGDADLPSEARDMVTTALLHMGAPAAQAPRVASALLSDHPLWGPAEWTLTAASPLSGTEESFRGILCCDEPMSPRCGIRLAHGITREQNERLARALGTWARG
ncbi:hypothetical protein AB0K02_03510 [Streptomyces sp. NPDC049597]|uniref:hypothetical protein n=1 Tax=Streptomyces sp. NPDC049597 TaxID=3155276 RepID=UPI00343BB2C5